jgi:hypothetical protein
MDICGRAGGAIRFVVLMCGPAKCGSQGGQSRGERVAGPPETDAGPGARRRYAALWELLIDGREPPAHAGPTRSRRQLAYSIF